MDQPFEGRRWVLAPEAIAYIQEVLSMPESLACNRLQQQMRDTNIQARDPLDDGALIDSEFWRFGKVTADGSAFNIQRNKGLYSFEVSAEDLVRCFPRVEGHKPAGISGNGVRPDKKRQAELKQEFLTWMESFHKQHGRYPSRDQDKAGLDGYRDWARRHHLPRKLVDGWARQDGLTNPSHRPKLRE